MGPVGACGSIVGMVATAKHLADGIGAVAIKIAGFVLFGVCGLVNVHIYVVLGRTTHVVTAVDVALLKCGLASGARRTDVDVYLPIDHRLVSGIA